MPEIKVVHVVSFSSEDKNHPVENLLKPEGTSKWRSGSNGEQHLTCVLQLEKAVKISQLDIGNEGSAFIEVLVGRSSSSESDYQVLLVASSFMNPTESRNGQNLTRVRIFTADKLNNAVLDEKWDRVKVVCSQPFNKSTKYGLSFIKLHSPGDSTDPQPTKQMTLGAFSLKSDEPSTSLKAGSLFANRHKETTPAKPLTGAAAARAASKQVEEEINNGTSRHAAPAKPTRRESQPEGKAFSDTRPSTSKHRNDDEKMGTERQASRDRGDRGDRPPMKRHSNSTSSVASEKSRQESPPPIKKSKSDPTREHPSRPLGRLMKKVIFVLSGFQNPERGNIRDRAMEMGATYRQDWGRDCTHLVCAFANTPKFNQVKKRGRIVTKDWVSQSYKRQKLLPWRKFRLGNAPTPPGSSASESEDEPLPTLHKANRDRETPQKKAAAEAPRRKSPLPSTSRDLDSDDPVLYEGSTDEEGDTDDDIERVRAETKKKRSRDVDRSSPPVVEIDDSSDGEDMMTNLPELPDFFTGKHFLLYGHHSPSQRRSLLRFIIAYNGKVEDYMSNSVHYVISKENWDEHFDDALNENPNLAFVRPDWVFNCNDKQKLVPHQKFVIVPN